MITTPDYSLERAALTRGLTPVAGVDEAGRGPLAGPVTAAAVILDPTNIPAGLNDSKKLSPKRRAALFDDIKRSAQWSVAHASVEEIDEINILRASHLAMVRAIAALPQKPALALIDGNMLPRDLPCPGQPIIKGDARALSIAAASIVAKFCRDQIMDDLAQHHPGYGWETNRGYPSKSHISALRDLGVTPHHRRSFKPVHNIL
ncbi:MAG: ribonuclease HII [Pseudomonadota bacterium]